MTEHKYISTACLHEKHDECRKQCKFCDAKCLCECHRQMAEPRHPPVSEYWRTEDADV